MVRSLLLSLHSLATTAVFPPALLAAPSQTEPQPISSYITRFTASNWLWWQPTSHVSAYNRYSCLCRKHERKTFLKVSVFSSRYFCSFWLNLFSFSRPVCTSLLAASGRWINNRGVNHKCNHDIDSSDNDTIFDNITKSATIRLNSIQGAAINMRQILIPI